MAIVIARDAAIVGGVPDLGGVATSTTTARRFTVDGRSNHHTIDPRTGRPATSDLVSATVVAPTAWEAETLATASLVEGLAGALELLAVAGAPGVLSTTTGACVLTPDLVATTLENV